MKFRVFTDESSSAILCGPAGGPAGFDCAMSEAALAAIAIISPNTTLFITVLLSCNAPAHVRTYLILSREQIGFWSPFLYRTYALAHLGGRSEGNGTLTASSADSTSCFS